LLGTDEWIADTKQRIGEIPRGARPQRELKESRLDAKALTEAIERVTGLKLVEICSAKKTSYVVVAKEAMIIVGKELGASNVEMAKLLGLDASVVSRRYESAKLKLPQSIELKTIVAGLRSQLNCDRQ
jgi:hypothetical protein